MEVGDTFRGTQFSDLPNVGDTLKVLSTDCVLKRVELQIVDRKPEPVVLSEGSRFTDPNYFLRIPEGTVIDRDGIRCYLGDYNGYDALIAVVSIQDTNNVWYVSNERKDNVTYTVRLLPPGVDEVKIP